MAEPSTYTWKREAPWSDRVCHKCGGPTLLKDGLYVSSTRQQVFHLWCRPRSVTFVPCGCHACDMAVAAIADAREAHK